MPLFDFKCAVCGQRFEVLVDADERARCPRCGSYPQRHDQYCVLCGTAL